MSAQITPQYFLTPQGDPFEVNIIEDGLGVVLTDHPPQGSTRVSIREFANSLRQQSRLAKELDIPDLFAQKLKDLKSAGLLKGDLETKTEISSEKTSDRDRLQKQ